MVQASHNHSFGHSRSERYVHRGHTAHLSCLWISWVLLLLTIVAGVFVLGALVGSLNDADPATLNAYSPGIVWTAILQIFLFLLGMGAFILFVTSNVSAVPATQAPEALSKPTLASRIAELKDAYFDFGKSTIRPDAGRTLVRDARLLDGIYRDFPDAKVVVEGHGDERGAADHNFGLGYERAVATRQFVGHLGVPSARVGVATYGKESPICDEHDESCWRQNRRVHLSALQ